MDFNEFTVSSDITMATTYYVRGSITVQTDPVTTDQTYSNVEPTEDIYANTPQPNKVTNNGSMLLNITRVLYNNLLLINYILKKVRYQLQSI